MAFNRLMLTTDGKTLYAKAQQGKTLQFTRVGIGDGDVGSGSLVNRTALISEKLSLLIDVIQLTNEETVSAIVSTLKNESLTEGFYFREIGIFARDPDTQTEKLYLYDNAGTDGEYIPDNQSGVIVSERLKFLITLENVTTVSFVPSGNPIYLTTEDIDDTVEGSYILWSSAKIASELLNKASAESVAAAEAAAKAASVPLTQKGVANGVAELDASGKVPSGQLPSYVDDALEYAALANFPATGEMGKIYVALDTNKTYRWSGSAYVEISPSIALGETSATAYRGDRGKTAYDFSQTITNLATAANDFLVASGAGVWVKKTVVEIKTLLGLGSAAYTASTAYAPAVHLLSIGEDGTPGHVALSDSVSSYNDAFSGIAATPAAVKAAYDKAAAAYSEDNPPPVLIEWTLIGSRTIVLPSTVGANNYAQMADVSDYDFLIETLDLNIVGQLTYVTPFQSTVYCSGAGQSFSGSGASFNISNKRVSYLFQKYYGGWAKFGGGTGIGDADITKAVAQTLYNPWDYITSQNFVQTVYGGKIIT